MAVTIKDVAKRANVAPSTVSRVISDSPKISAKTKKEVRAIMKELDYHPNQIARSLTNQSTKTLGLLLPETEEVFLLNPFFSKSMKGISLYAKKKGYYILLVHTEKDEDDIATLNHIVNSRRVDGIILPTVKTNDSKIEFLKNQNHPFVVIGKPENNDDVLWVDNNNRDAMYNVVNILAEKGHKSIAFIGGEHDFQVTKDRLQGYKDALEDNGLVFDERFIYEKQYTEQAAYDATLDMIKYKTPDAIVTTDDMLAFGSQNALIEKELNTVSVAGFNNTILSQYRSPSISSVDINAELLGRHATKLLISAIENEELEINSYIVDTELIVRDSIIDHH